MTKKIFAIVLAAIMVLCALPFTAVADDESTTAEARVAGWDANFETVIEKLLTNEKSAHWQYVAENNKEISDTMITYTVFALYDDAWKNGFDHSVSIDNAEKILCSLIEKVDANIGDSKVAEIIKVLKTASDFNDLLQKVNGVIKFSDTLNSAEWNTAFKAIKTAIELGNLYEEQRDKVIEAYAQILSVQAANEYYKDFLRYLANNCTYNVVATAANNLVAHINDSVEDILKDEAGNSLAMVGSKFFEKAARLAMDSNAYTAVALKVYDVGTSVADALWNTSDQYVLMDELYTTFFAETSAKNYVYNARANGGAEMYEYAIGILLGLREAGSQALYDLKLAQNEGIVGKIRNQINYNVSFKQVEEMAFLQLAKDVLFNKPVSAYKPVSTIVTVDTIANVFLNDMSLFNQAGIFSDDNGYYSVYLNDNIGLYVKTAFIVNDLDIMVRAGEKTYATAVIEKIGEAGIYDFSFTNAICGMDGDIIFNSDIVNNRTYTSLVNDAVVTSELNHDFVYPPYNAVNLSTISNAVVSVVSNEAKGKVIELKDLINSIINSIKTFFATLFAGFKK
jgi:hypothetical protein